MQIIHSQARLEALCRAFARQVFPDRRKQRPAACT